MALNVVYVDDEVDQRNLLKEAVDARNQKTPDSARVVLLPATSPDELAGTLGVSTDVVLADVCYPDSEGRDANRLDDLIRIVREWESRIGRTRPLPIIAITGKGKKYTEFCLERKDCLYDIWEKNAASPEYRAWRLSRLAAELPRVRPDALIQCLVTQMGGGARWHNHVLDMVRRYDHGRTEADQVERAGEAVLHIADVLGLRGLCADAWEATVKSEGLVRAACQSARGHARHVLNVFWIGYYLLHHPSLRKWAEKVWDQLVKDRGRMGMVGAAPALEALSDVWFYTAAFHDFAYLLEKSAEVQAYHVGILKHFGDLANQSVAPQRYFADDLDERLGDFLRKEFDDPKKEKKDADSPGVASMKKVSGEDCAHGAPDHGLLSALHFHRLRSRGDAQECLVSEAARAIALHHVVCAAEESSMRALLSWQKEPVSCLLLLCDQLQTWDREPHDKTWRHDLPERAELSQLEITQDGDKPHVRVAIDYIAPAHLERSPEVFERVKDDLDRILAKHPKSALERIADDWPFQLDVTCTMSGTELSTKMSFPRRAI